MNRDIPPPLTDRKAAASRGDGGGRLVHVVIGQHAIGRGNDQALATTLGSCVAACANDPVAAIGGMNHFLLPEAPEGTQLGSAATRYGRPAMDTLIDALIGAGCRRERLEFKIFGAGQIISSHFDIAGLNADFILSYLHDQSLTLVSHDLGGRFARRVIYYPSTGRVLRRLVRPEALSDALNREFDLLSLIRRAPSRKR